MTLIETLRRHRMAAPIMTAVVLLMGIPAPMPHKTAELAAHWIAERHMKASKEESKKRENI